jgi:hypothetical protein
VLDCHHGIFFLIAVEPMWRIFGLIAALHTDDDPSGIVHSVEKLWLRRRT